ncbi:phosphate ABC transporter substrate-binding protein [Bifidobacterium dolichotidis]|uniref:Phosphate-binding protein n=1 Tax=Bifidobacterium dolichotidis TaxID=2306976 RepID=A0A430FQ93_9BIFI|nr:phosphate ABC transporter substrate-binding protein PstS [Bifidobacterium dolichotidis]RSX55022.1 phosphate ABC transporter substrate-binding protein [Bifidobacterium dolichotidis]
MLCTVAACGDNAPIGGDTGAEASGITGNYAGAGASSQQAAVEAWISGFTSKNPGTSISYNPTGSGAGVTTFLTGATAWAASDKALSAKEVQESKSVCGSGTAFDVPVYISPIAVTFNLGGLEPAKDGRTHLNMDAPTIAKIFNGSITRWNDAALQQQNPDVKLPDLPITVVHRSDKSGTTQNFVEYLKAAAPDDWKYDLSENWPNNVGQGAKGSTGVVNTIGQANGTIGYSDLSTIGTLGTVDVKVGDQYVTPSPEAATKAIADSQIAKNLEGANRVVIDVNHTTSADDAYPVVLVSYDIVCPVYKDEGTTKFAKAWLTYVTGEAGQRMAQRAAGSAPLPQNIVSHIRTSINAMGADAQDQKEDR